MIQSFKNCTSNCILFMEILCLEAKKKQIFQFKIFDLQVKSYMPSRAFGVPSTLYICDESKILIKKNVLVQISCNSELTTST